MKTSLAACTDVAGSGPAGMLLFSIAYWQPRMKIKKGGVKWIVKSREEWMAQTKLSRNQVDRAFKKLRDAGLIDTTKGFFGGRRTLLHTRLTDTALTMLRTGSTAPKSAPGFLKSEKTGFLKSEKTQSQKLTTQKQKKTASQSSEAVASLKGSGDMKTSDIHAKLLSSPKKPKRHSYARACEGAKPANGKSLSILWKHLHAEHYHGKGFLGAFTKKELGQFKMFAKKVAPTDPQLVMSTCLQHWIAYCAKVQSEVGINYSPDMPAIGWLLQYSNQAVQFTQDKTKPKKTGIISEPDKSYMKFKPVQLIATEAELAAKKAAAEAEHQKILKLLADADE